jgi:SNF2-related domain/SNF2 Helicase protein/Helicase conserved C-terminal domain
LTAAKWPSTPLYMIDLHAIWTDRALHLWGMSEEATKNGHRHSGNGNGSPARYPQAVSIDQLRSLAGDNWENLLIADAKSSEMSLRLPTQPNGKPTATEEPLSTYAVPTLAFGPADAIDLLSSLPREPDDGVAIGGSLRYWSRASELVLELLARQAFVPALHRGANDAYRGYWRVVVDDEITSEKLRRLIVSMPPVCRCEAIDEDSPQAATLLESFLWTSVDCLVRRCLSGDELAHSLQEHSEETLTPQMRWLRALVGNESAVLGVAEENARVHQVVREWIGRLEPALPPRSCRSCFRLHAPDEDGEPDVWRLTLHVQATSDASLIVDAGDLSASLETEPTILQRPFDNAMEQLRTDVVQATRHFPPLLPCGEANGPVECSFGAAEAYNFLRNAAPILESEGHGVFLPSWWRRGGPRLQMQLGLKPTTENVGLDSKAIRLDSLVAYDWHVAIGDKELSLEEISALAHSKEPLLRVHDQWVEIQPADAQAALTFLQQHPAGEMTLFEAIRQCYIADDLETGIPMAGFRAEGWVRLLLDSTDFHASIDDLPQPENFDGELRPYQLKGMQWLSFLSRLGLGACLADDMGLGKTIQMIALWLTERKEGKSPGPTLLVVPMSLVGNWQREIARFGESLRVLVHHGLDRYTGQRFVEEAEQHDIVISTYALAHRDFDHLTEVKWHRIALDEAQNIKNSAAKQSVAVRSLRALHRVALTGTPVENRLSELWSIMNFLNPGYLGQAGDFRRRFAVPIERHHDEHRGLRLRQLIRPFVLRRLKSDPTVQVDLPAKMEMKVYCNLTKEQAALYEAMVNSMMAQIDQSEGIQRRGLVLATLVKLKQICNHPAHFLADDSAIPKRSGKCDRLTDMLEEALQEGDRALVFTQFKQMGSLLKPHLEHAFGQEVLFLHGGLNRKKRDEIVERFQNEGDEPRVMLLSLKAGGFGLNLTAANHVFHFDRWWNPAVEDQATDRVHRIGQVKQVQVHKFVCIGTLEERIDAMLEKKRNLADKIVGSGESWLTELSTDALRDLFELSRDAVGDD